MQNNGNEIKSYISILNEIISKELTFISPGDEEANELEKSSDITGKRQFLSYLLQNPTVNGKNLEFTIASPFNLVLELASHPNWLPRSVLKLDLSNVVRAFELLLKWDRDAGRSV